jgi:hypothetical protein
MSQRRVRDAIANHFLLPTLASGAIIVIGTSH